MSSLVINEFEVVPKPVVEPATAQTGAQQSGPPKESPAREVKRLIVRQHERTLRLKAY